MTGCSHDLGSDAFAVKDAIGTVGKLEGGLRVTGV